MSDLLIRTVRRIRRSDLIDALNLDLARLRDELDQKLALVRAELSARERAHLEFADQRDRQIALLKQDLADRKDVAEALVRRLDEVSAERDMQSARAAERDGLLTRSRAELVQLVVERDSLAVLEITLRAEAVRLDHERRDLLALADELRAALAAAQMQQERLQRELELAAQVQMAADAEAVHLRTHLETLLETTRAELANQTVARDSFRAECERLGASEAELTAKLRAREDSTNSAQTGQVLDATGTVNAAAGAVVRRVNRQAHERQYFVTFSLGRTATQWLTDVLNSHPHVLATHAFDYSPQKRAVSSIGNEFVASLDRQAKAIARSRTIDDAFDQFDNPEYRVIGNVHGIDALPAFENPDRFKRQYYASYITRNPIIRTRSLVNRWKYENELTVARRNASAEAFGKLDAYCRRFSEKYDIEISSEEDKLFVLALQYLFPAEVRYLKSQIPVILYERLVHDPDYLMWHLRQISGGVIELSDEFITSAIQRGPVDRRGNSRLLARQEYVGWSTWQKDMFADRLQSSGIAHAYNALGYETAY